MTQFILLDESATARRSVDFFITDSTGLLPYTAGSGGTAKIRYPGIIALVDTDTLTPYTTGTGHYQITLASADVHTLGPIRAVFPYSSGTNLEAYADIQIVAVDPYNATSFGLSRLDAAISSRSTLASGTFDANIVLIKGTAAVGTQGTLDVGLTGSLSELTAIPGDNPGFAKMIQYLFSYFKHKRTVSKTTETVFRQDGATVLGTSSITDDGVTFTHNELV